MHAIKISRLSLSSDDDAETLALRLKNTEKALQLTQQNLNDEFTRWRMMIEQSRDGIVVLDQDGSVYEANQQFAEMLGYTKDQVSKLHVWDWDAVFPEEQIREMIRTVDHNGDHFETRHRRKDGSIIDVELSTNGAIYRDQKLIFCICRDITERKRLQQALEESEERYRKLSILDELTQLYNSRYFYDQLEREVDRASRSGQSLALMILDIDNFKKYNDQYGHISGDKALAEIAQVLKQCLRHTDSAYRYGGEEFTVLLPGTALDGAFILAEKVRVACKALSLAPEPGSVRHITVSIGVSQYCSGDSGRALVQRADQGLYKAKNQGKDMVLDVGCSGME